MLETGISKLGRGGEWLVWNFFRIYETKYDICACKIWAMKTTHKNILTHFI